MAYPPDDHMLRALAIENLVEQERAISRIPVTPYTCNEAGGVRLGVVAVVVDVAAAMITLADLFPDRAATVTLSLQSTAMVRKGPLIASAKVVRKGSRQVLVDVEIVDGQGSENPEDGAPCARGLVGFRRLSLRSDHAELPPMPERPSVSTLALPSAALAAPFVERAGIRVIDADLGILELSNHAWVRNSFGTLNGGMVATMLEMAGEQAARSVLGPDLVASDLEIHYVGQSGDGPMRTRAVRTRVGAEHCVTRVELRDGSRGDELMALGSVTSCRLP
jgi:acyl-coenzyme A thioesterase PaaI-like protein